MLLCKNRRLFTVAGDNSHVLTPIHVHLIPIPIPWLILLPFPWESHGTHGIPLFPIPMHTSSCNYCGNLLLLLTVSLRRDGQNADAGTAGAVAEYRHPVGIASECTNVELNPAQRLDLIP